jgi:iduronate 2-sulfatase
MIRSLILTRQHHFVAASNCRLVRMPVSQPVGRTLRRSNSYSGTFCLIMFSVLWMQLSGASAIFAAPPNILFIAVDDLRPELGCYGESHIISPNIDKLANQGVVFKRAYCQFPVCNASRASIMTGLRPDSTGVFGNKTRFRSIVPDVVTLPQQFKQFGYRTQALGKIYHGAFEKAYVGRTFDDPPSWSGENWYGSPQYYFTERGIQVARDVFSKKHSKANADSDAWKAEFVQGLATEAPDVLDNVLYDGAMTDRAIETLSELKGKPFFLAVGYLKPHLPFVAPKKYWDLYKREELAMPHPASPPKDVPAIALQNGNELRSQYIDMRGAESITESQTRELRHGYYACVSYLDSQVGRLIAELDRLELRENTIIVLWGDHGWHLGEQGLWAKLTNFERAARVPLIVAAPRQKANGLRSDSLVEFVDVYPTLCELAGLPLPLHLEGTSFVPLLNDPNKPWKKAAFTQVVHGDSTGRSLRTDRYRFTRWSLTKTPSKAVAFELYDHHLDPNETENIVNRSESSVIAKELAAMLDAGWKMSKPD